MTSFERDTAVERTGAGTFRAELSAGWNAPILPQGGIVTAMALRAMAAELNEPSHTLRSVTTAFAAQVPAGPVEIDVTLLRRGRTLSQVLATVRAVGEPAGHTSIAVFGTARPGFEFTDIAPPVVPPPDELPSFDDPPPEDFADEWAERFQPSFWEQTEGRPAIGHAPWDPYVPTSSERAYWYRLREIPRRDDGTVDPFAFVVLCDTMPGAVGERMGPGPRLWLAPSADLTVHVLGDATSDWLIAHNRARHAGDGYASVEQSLWDPERGLVAYATQMMFFSFPDGPPPPAERIPPDLRR